MLYLDMPTAFPAFPPKARFITKILHPNVNPHGRICHSIFDRTSCQYCPTVWFCFAKKYTQVTGLATPV